MLIIIMKEKFHPQPENPKPNAPEPAAGPLGIPPPSEAKRDRRRQGEEAPPAQGEREITSVQPLFKLLDILDK
jgi:hypothetical protein